MANNDTARRRAVSDDEKELRRESILAAAKGVFAEKGYHATTIADVAKRAEISYGSVYWYFDSKEALFHALIDAQEQAFRDYLGDSFATAASGGSDAVGAFKSAVRATFEFFESDRAATKLLFRDAYALGEGYEQHLYDIYEVYIGEIESVLRQLQETGIVREAPPRVMAFTVAALVSQLSHRRLVTDDGLDAATVADFVVDMLVDGILVH